MWFEKARYGTTYMQLMLRFGSQDNYFEKNAVHFAQAKLACRNTIDVQI